MRLSLSLLLGLGAVAVLAGVWWCRFSRRDYAALFRRQKGRFLHNRRRQLASTDRTVTYDVTLLSDTGRAVEARLRLPQRPGDPALLLTVGINTGKRAVDLIGEHEDLVIMALDYGWQEAFDITTTRQILHMLPRVRAASRQAVPGLLLALDELAAEPQVDPDQLILVGVSYGAYFSIVAAALDERVAQTIIVQGGAPIDQTMARNAGFWHSPIPARWLGWLGNQVFQPYRPERWIGQLSPRRVTFVASRRDAMLPADGVERIHRLAGEPKQLIWHDLPHVHPDSVAVITELAKLVIEQVRAGATTTG